MVTKLATGEIVNLTNSYLMAVENNVVRLLFSWATVKPGGKSRIRTRRLEQKVNT
jgi:hypothetical protein